MNFAEAIAAITNLLGTLGGFHRHRSDREDAALELLFQAINETKIYLARLQQGRARSRKREEALSRQWSAAAVAVRRIDPQLANRCLMKSDHWLWPDRWSKRQVKQARIGIDEIHATAKGLLRRK